FIASCGSVRVETEFADRERFPRVVADAGCLEQVFTNLVLNAALAMKDEGTGTILIRTASSGDEISVEVADTGCGMPEENIDRILEPFSATRPGDEGTGLGLFVCREIVHDHGGTITVRSSPGQGTTFRVSFPVAAEEKSA